MAKAPSVVLHDEILRENARAWAQRLRVPIHGVVKGNGYGWGMVRVARALERDVAGFFVSEAGEALALRSHTALPIRTFAATDAATTRTLLDARVVPNVASLGALHAVGHGERIRVGVVPAAGWSGIVPEEAAAFSSLAAQRGAEVELWTHLTADQLAPRQRERMLAVRDVFRAAGVVLCGMDLASTFSSQTAQSREGTLARIGIGLFGAGQLKCAVTIDAQVVDAYASARVESAGYRERTSFRREWLAVVRCGYLDALPKGIVGQADIVSVGMQYAVVETAARAEIGSWITLLATSADLDALTVHANIGAHELIVALGNASARCEEL